MKKLDIEKITNNRLWKLMKDNDITDCKPFARLLIDGEFYTFDNFGDKSADSTSNEYKQYYKNVDTLSKTITHCLYDNCYKKDNLLIACCRFFKCSADYLLGFIDLPTHADTDIHNKTGLTKDAIDILSKNKNSYFPVAVEAINLLLQNNENINDNMRLLELIQQYVLLSQDIKSYDECGVSKMENKNIALRDEYGTAMGLVPVDEMANIFLLSINRLLTKLKDNISTKRIHKKPTIFDILDDMLFDLIRIEEIRKNIDGFNFDIDNLYQMDRRFRENNKRLIYLYGCDTINDIDFKIFKSKYPQYSDDEINFLKSQLNLE
ncbi:hypothetical protein AALB81_18700 [Lachnospiraceae bacterium 48-33]